MFGLALGCGSAGAADHDLTNGTAGPAVEVSLDALVDAPVNDTPARDVAPKPAPAAGAAPGAPPARAPAPRTATPEAASPQAPADVVPTARAPAVDAPGLDPAVLDLALRARECARKGGAAGDRADTVLSVIDFRLPSTEPRLWVLDLAEGSTVFRERVAHGRNTGELASESFSNIPGSNQSSIGLYRTAEPYVGKHGRSLRLDGLDPGWNDRARDRAIVVHAAEYCTLGHVEKWGRLGRSQGCPALDPAVSDAVIDTIRDGTLLFAYYPDQAWLSGSPWLGCEATAGS